MCNARAGRTVTVLSPYCRRTVTVLSPYCHRTVNLPPVGGSFLTSPVKSPISVLLCPGYSMTGTNATSLQEPRLLGVLGLYCRTQRVLRRQVLPTPFPPLHTPPCPVRLLPHHCRWISRRGTVPPSMYTVSLLSLFPGDGGWWDVQSLVEYGGLRVVDVQSIVWIVSSL